jgi:hypothetical protein
MDQAGRSAIASEADKGMEVDLLWLRATDPRLEWLPGTSEGGG